MTITATGSDGATASTTFALTVNNVAPTVVADNAAVTVDEGQTAVNTGTFADPGADIVTLTASVGTVTAGAGTWSWSFETTDGPDESQTVTISATDSDGATTTTIFTLTEALGSVEVFADSFEVAEWNGLWTEDRQNDWFRSTQRATDGNRAAEVDGRARDATLTSIPIDLQGRTSATVSFSWYIERRLDRGEYLAFDVSTNGGVSWSERARLRGNVDRENRWHHETFDLNSLGNSIRIRFRGRMSRRNEDANVDNVKVIAH